MLVYYGSMHIYDILIYCNNTLTCSAFFKKKQKTTYMWPLILTISILQPESSG